MTRAGKAVRTASVFAIGLLALGCGRSDLPQLGDVEGVVKIDGVPFENAMVQFHNEKGGRPGSGVTDKDGKYKLQYNEEYSGTKVGPSRVEITTIWPEGEPPPGKKDPILPKYNAKSELKEEVKPGKNTFNFDLKSK